MPYKIVKKGSKWALVKRGGVIKSKHKSKKMAERVRKLLMFLEHKPKSYKGQSALSIILRKNDGKK